MPVLIDAPSRGPDPPVDLPTILCVDDTPENLHVLRELLRDQYRVRVAPNGERALRAAGAGAPPDLVLLDIMMPGMDGYAVLEQLRADPRTREVPVLFLTALDSVEDEARGLALGAVDYLTKPLKPAIVRARVAAHLELKVARDRLKDQNRWLESEVARRVRLHQEIQDVTLRALASLAEIRDNETGAHILRTQAFVGRLCAHLAAGPRDAEELSAERCLRITQAAPLHDIGKVGIPDAILLKPGKLDADEWAVMRTHAELGGLALERAMRGVAGAEGFPFLEVAIQIARGHHEKWDGSGYPVGVSGEQIPLPARIMAVADVYDALRTERPYKRPWALDRVRAHFEAERGHHFDPVVVDALFACWDDFIEIAQAHQDPPEITGGAA
jgi:putative two-component system response regulator